MKNQKSQSRSFLRRPLACAILACSFVSAIAVTVATETSGPATGPVFYNGENITLLKYTSKEKKKRVKLTIDDIRFLQQKDDDLNPNPPVFRLTVEEKTALGLEVLPDDPATLQDLTPSERAREFLVQNPNATYSQKSRAGTYVYTGDAPRFSSDNLEMYVSKIGLTLRVKAWVDAGLIDGYRGMLLNRWLKIYRDFHANDVLSIEPLKDPKKVYAGLKAGSLKTWMKVALQYMHSAYDRAGTFQSVITDDDGTIRQAETTVYTGKGVSPQEYKEQVLLGWIRSLLGQPDLTIDQALALATDVAKNPKADRNVQASRALFDANLGSLYSADTTHVSANGVPSAGYLTFVYPIAANKLGPYNVPREQLQRFGGPGKTYAPSRIFSDFWGDEYGGFPFMEVVDGVGAHGPITAKEDLNIWFLERGYVSHGCFRMNADDALELRALLPVNVFSAPSSTAPILRITEWPDTVDLNNSGAPEIIDVGYYFFPMQLDKKLAYFLTPETIAAQPAPKTPAKPTTGPAPVPSPSVSPRPPVNAQTTFWIDHFKSWASRKSFLDPATQLPLKLQLDPIAGVVRNVPVYSIGKDKYGRDVPVISAILPEAKIRTFKPRETSLFQYHDATAIFDDQWYTGTDGKGGTRGVTTNGKFPPQRFIGP